MPSTSRKQDEDRGDDNGGEAIGVVTEGVEIREYNACTRAATHRIGRAMGSTQEQGLGREQTVRAEIVPATRILRGNENAECRCDNAAGGVLQKF